MTKYEDIDASRASTLLSEQNRVSPLNQFTNWTEINRVYELLDDQTEKECA